MQWAYTLLTSLALNQETCGDVKEGCREVEDPYWDKQQMLNTQRHTHFLLLSCWTHTRGSNGSWPPVQSAFLNFRAGYLGTTHTGSTYVTDVRTDKHTNKQSTNLGKLHFQNINLSIYIYMYVCIRIFFHRKALVRNAPNHQIIANGYMKVVRYG